MKRSNLDDWICRTEHRHRLTRSDLESLQLLKLNQLLKRERETGGFYQHLPDHLCSLEELPLLPFTTAEMLSRYGNRFLITSQSQVAKVISGATSGTTGPSKRVFYTETDTANTVGFFAAGISEMVRPGDRVLIMFPFSGPFGLGELIEQAVLSLNAAPLRIGARKTYREICEFLAEEKPDCYIGFPIPLLSLARFFDACLHPSENSEKSPAPFFDDPEQTRVHPHGSPGSSFPIRRALVSGDACPKSILEQLERLLQNPLFPHYGSREMGLGGAITCPAHEGMHLRENHIIGEIIGSDLRPVPDGQWGELVITTIGLEAMPLIRYRTGDYTRFLPEPCPCGSVTRRLDTVSRIASSPLSIEALDSILFSVPALIDYQAKQDDGQFIITAYTQNGNSQEQLLARLNASFPALSFVIQERICQPEDTALYAGKRYIM